MKLTASQRAEICRIALASTVDEASEEDLATLNELLAGNQAAREHFIRLVQLHASLSWRGVPQELLPSTEEVESLCSLSCPEPVSAPCMVGSATSSGIAVCDQVSDNTVAWSSPSAARGIRLPFGSVPVGIATIVAGLLVWVFAYFGRDAFFLFDSKTEEGAVVAELRNAECVWGGPLKHLEIGTPLRSCEPINLVEGVAKLRFGGDTTVVVEGPAVIEPITPMSMRLTDGSAVVRANGARKDFTVISPDASIVDLGTSFGVHVAKADSTEVEVFEGAVEIHPDAGSAKSRVLGLGGSALVRRSEQGTSIDLVGSAEDRFSNLLKEIWDDIRQDSDADHEKNNSVVEAEFNDAPIPKTVDTFYGSKPGRGWATPWLAVGNPTGTVRHKDALSGGQDPYLSLKFGPSTARVVAREYGRRGTFNPRKPHVISWRWRFDGDFKQFGGHYRDRVLFYANSSFHTNTDSSLSWLICVVGAAEEEAPPRDGELRHFFPMSWCFFSPFDEGKRFLDGRDMVDTGMKLRPGVVYNFAVAVYPQEGRYDAAIRDDQQTVIRTGLKFRNSEATQQNVVHFNIRTANKKRKLGFSLDSVRIEPMEDDGLQRRIQQPTGTTAQIDQ